MVDTFFYPHIVQKQIGNAWIDQCECRDQRNNRGGMITIGDKISYVFKSLIFFPNSHDVVFIPGEKIRIKHHKTGEIRIAGDVVGFSPDELEDNRIWI